VRAIWGLAYVTEEGVFYGLVQPLHDGHIELLGKLNAPGALIDTVPLSEPLL
jgi:hypothetical protein